MRTFLSAISKLQAKSLRYSKNMPCGINYERINSKLIDFVIRNSMFVIRYSTQYRIRSYGHAGVVFNLH